MLNLKIFKNKKRQSTINIVFLAILCLTFLFYIFFQLVPVVWAICNSFKDVFDFIIDPSFFPKEWHIENYLTAFSNMEVSIFRKAKGVTVVFDIYSMFGYSIIISGVTSFVQILQPVLMSYIIANYDFPAKKLLFSLAILVLILPIIGSLPSALVVNKIIGTYDNIFPFLLTRGGPFGMNFLLLHGFFKGLPRAYKEAAFIDGANHLDIMLKIYMPLLLPVFTALYMLAFIGNWNDYMTIIIWLPSYPSLAYGAFHFQASATEKGSSVPEVLAGFVIVSVPTIIIWAASQKLISKNLIMGGLKG